MLGYLPLCRNFFYIKAQKIGSIPPYNSFSVFLMQIQQLLKELDGEFLEVLYHIFVFTLYELDGELFPDRGKPENRKNHLFLFSKLFPLISCA